MVDEQNFRKEVKKIFQLSMQRYIPTDEDNFTEEQKEFLKTKRTLTDFKKGLKITGKLIPKIIKGCVLLVETCYEMRE